jgi:hypothetical protein
MRRVIVESPYAGKTEAEIDRNIRFARACVRDCILHGEAPFASHLLYTQPKILADAIPEERSLGMRAGFSWVEVADATIVYTNLGISRGMKAGIQQAEKHRKPVEYRTLLGDQFAVSDDEPTSPGE